MRTGFVGGIIALVVVAGVAGAEPAATKEKGMGRKVPSTNAGDEATSHLFGDTTVSPERKQSMFWDEAPPETTAEEKSETTAARAVRLAALAAAADSVSSASNAAWMKENRHVEPIPADFPNVKVKLGDEVLFEDEQYTKLIRGKRIALITNPSGMDSNFVSTIDKLANSKDWKLNALFAPEHGVRGAQGAGEKVVSGVDPVSGVHVYSLYGSDAKKRAQNKPRASMLRDIDVLMYDIQDIGNRSYTYVSTMKLGMQAAVENDKEFIVLDRPNPMGGELVSGNVLDQKYATAVGWAPVAYLYGLTAGEVAMWLNDHYKMNCKLTVVPMEGWKRSMKWWDTGLPWIPTSTHMQTPEACWHIAITGTLGELNSVNEGVGYPLPFAYVGAPWINSERFAHELNKRHLPGIYFRPAYYKPYYLTFKDRQCGGVQLHIYDFDKVMPVETGMHIIEAINKLYPEQKILSAGADADTTKTRARIGMFNKVMGTNKVRKGLLEGRSAQEVTDDWAAEREQFRKEREKYFLYK